MSVYRRVEVKLWIDPWFRAADHQTRLAWMYLLSGPNTQAIPGVIVVREEEMAVDLKIDVRTLRQTFRERFPKGSWKADWEAGLVVLPKALFEFGTTPRDSHRPDNPNVFKSWSTCWDSIPDCQLKDELLSTLESYSETLGETFAKGFRERWAKPLAKRLGKGSPKQDQEQEQEQEQQDPPLPPFGGNAGVGADRSERKTRSPRKAKPSDLTPDEEASAKRVLDRIGSRTGVKYQGSTAHLRLIVRQLRGGRNESRLRAIVAYVWDPSGLGWSEKPTMHGYLRPETLFGPEAIERYDAPALAWLEKHFPEEAIKARAEAA